MKKVSVIIPTYKRSDNLLRAIQSVINQTYKNMEIIVVDDNDENSSYRKENILKLKEYVETKQIKYLKHKTNKNGSAARNTGIKACTGDYITFLDDDDYFINNRIEKMVNKMNNHPEYSCIYSAVAFSKNNKIISVVRANKKGNLQLDLLYQNSFFKTGSNLFFRKEIIDKVGLFDEKFIRHQDMEYMVRFFNYGTIMPIDEILVVKCVDDTSNIPDFSNMLLTKKMYLNKFANEINNYSQKEINEIYYRNYYELMCVYPDKHKELISIVNKYHKMSFKDKLKYLYKKFCAKSNIFSKIIFAIKKIKYRKYKYLVF